MDEDKDDNKGKSHVWTHVYHTDHDPAPYATTRQTGRPGNINQSINIKGEVEFIVTVIIVAIQMLHFVSPLIYVFF